MLAVMALWFGLVASFGCTEPEQRGADPDDVSDGCADHSLSTAMQRAGADWTVSASVCAGAQRWTDLTANGNDVVNEGRGAHPVSPRAWEGLRIVGGLASSVGARWPERLDIRWRGRLLPLGHDGKNMWNEVLLVTIDEDEDYLELAFVNEADGVRLGLDFRLDGETSERQWTSRHPLPDPHRDHDYRITMDGSQVAAYVDGERWDAADLDDIPSRVPGRWSRPPHRLAAPPDGSPLEIARNSVALSTVVLLDDIDGLPLHSADAADGEAGDTEVVSEHDAWGQLVPSSLGIVTGPFGTTRMIRGQEGWRVRSSELLDIGANTSFTWSARWRVWAPGSLGGTWWSRTDTLRFLAGEPGWAFVGTPLPSGPTYGFIIGARGPEVIVDAGSRPLGDHLVTAVLDRVNDELRLYLDSDLIDVADASMLGDVSASTPMDVLAYAGADAEEFGMWRRALDPTEIEALSAAME